MQKRPRFLTESEANEAASRYQAGDSTYTLGKHFGMTPNGVLNVIRRAGIARRQGSQSYTNRVVNDDTFSELSEHVAYWVGFLMADGCIHSGSNTVRLTLADQDRGHVEKFKAFTGSSRTIRSVPSRGGNAQPQCNLTITSSKMVADLSRFGVVDRKTYTACLKGGVEHDRHCFRGLVDGDGHVSWKESGHPRLTLAGSEQVVSQFREFCLRFVPTTSQIRLGGFAGFRFELEGQFAAEMILRLYSDCSVSLERKQVVAENVRAFYQPPKLCWKTIPTSELHELKSRLGKWRLVAQHFGMNRTDIYRLIATRGIRP